MDRNTARYDPAVNSEKDTQIRPGSSSTCWIGRSESTIMYQNGTTVISTRMMMVRPRTVPQTFSSVLRTRRRWTGAAVSAAARAVPAWRRRSAP